MKTLIMAIEALSKWSGRTASWLILTMAGTIGFEVVMRYFFAAPTSWAHECMTMQYGVYCMFLGAYTHVQNGHVRMDAFYRRVSERAKAGIDFFTGIFALGYLSVFFMTSAKFAKMSWDVKEISSMTIWEPPFYPFKIAIAIGVLLFVIQQIGTLLRNLLILINRSDLVPEVWIEGIQQEGSNDGSH